MIRPDEIEKLLGGWATGTLSPAERKALLDASLTNQALFDALADEEELRALLADPKARAELLAVLRPAHAAAVEPRESWWSWLLSPAPMAAFGAGALAVLLFVMVRPGSVVAPPAVVQEAPKSVAAVPQQDATAPAKEVAALPQPVTMARRDAPARVTAPPPPPPPSPASAEPAAVVSEDKRRKNESVVEVGEARKEKAATSAVADAVAPAAAPTAQPPPPPVAAAKRAPTPPVRYWVERRQADGTWVQFGGELTRGDTARIVIEALQPGFVGASVSGFSSVENLAAGQRMVFPVSGALPSDAGTREIALAFTRPQQPMALGGAVGGRPEESAKRQLEAEQSQQRFRAVGPAITEQQQQKQMTTPPPADHMQVIRVVFR